MSKGWIGVDLDGTLAHYDYWRGPHHIGNPVPKMMARVKAWLDAGIEVRIFTARATDPICVPIITDWLTKHGLPELVITSVKDFQCIQIWDDRAVQVVVNTGNRVGKG